MKKLIYLACISLSLQVSAQLDRSVMPKPAEAATIQLKESEVFTTKNGIIVILSENHKLPKVSFDLTLGYTPGMEGAKAGLGELTGSLIMSGTKNRSKDVLDKEIDFIGASLTANSTNLYLSTLTKHMEKGLEVMSDLTSNANFPTSEFERVVKQYQSSLLSVKSEGEAMANNATVKVNFPNHPYGEVMTVNTLSAISLEDVKNYYAANFTPQGAYMVIVGDITRAQAEQMMEKHFGSWTGKVPSKPSFADPKKLDGNQVYFVNKTGSVQSVIHVSFPLAMRMGDPNNLKMSVLNDVFGGNGFGTRLMQNLREDKAYTYGCYSGLNFQNEGGWVSITGNFRNAVTDSAITEIVNELNRLLSEKVSDDELALTKATKTGSFARSLERPQTIARFAYNIQRYGLPTDYYKNYLTKLNAISSSDLLVLAQSYLKENNYNIVVVGNEEVLEKLKKFDSDGKIIQLDEFGDIKQAMVPADITAKDLALKYTLAVTQTKDLKSAMKKIAKVKSMTQNSTLKSDKIPFPLSNTEIYTNKGIRAEKMEFGGNVAQKSYFDGKTGYTFNMQTGEQKMTDEELKMAAFEQALFPEANLANNTSTVKMELLGIESDGANKYYVLKITQNENAQSINYYNVKTFMKEKVTKIQTVSGETESATSQFDQFLDEGGFLFPHHLIVATAPITFDINIDKIEINGVVDLKGF